MRSFVGFFFFLASFPVLAQAPASAPPVHPSSPVVFEEMRELNAARARYVARSGDASLTIDSGGFTTSFSDKCATQIRASLAGARTQAVVRATNRQLAKINYFIGRDPKAWITDVPVWSRLVIDDAYPGIDLVFRGEQGRVEYDFIVRPGAEVSTIGLRIDGAAEMNVDESGALRLVSGCGQEVRHHSPRAWQDLPSGRRTIPASLVLGNGVVSFVVGDYDRRAPLVIDPVVALSTYLGGNSIEQGEAITVDSAGNIYVAGSTYSSTFPLANAYQTINRSSVGERDAFVSKFDPTGTMLLFSTYLGGAGGRDIANDIAVDKAGNVYIAGDTHSLDFPVTPGAFQTNANRWVGDDGFVVKLSPQGNALVYSTYLSARSGSPSNEHIRAIEVDESGFAWLAGDSEDQTWPVTPGAYQTTGCGGFNDGFVTKMNTTGTGLVYSTYLCGAGTDWAYDLAVDAAGNAYVSGLTSSENFPQVGPRQVALRGYNDAWVAKLSPNGASLLFSTLIGGRESDSGSAIALGSDGSIYIAGKTNSPDFPTINGYQASYAGSPNACFDSVCGDSFIAKFGGDWQLRSATYFGGRNDDDIVGLVAGNGTLSVVGTTVSTDFPLMNPLQSKFGGARDAFVAVFDDSLGRLSFSTFLGGSGWDVGLGIADAGDGSVVVTGFTFSSNFPTVNAYQASRVGDGDVFVTRITGMDTSPPRRRPVRR